MTTTDQQERLRRAVRELADAVPVPPSGPAAILAAAAARARPRPSAAARWSPVFAAVLVLAAVAVTGLVPGLANRLGGPPRPGGQPTAGASTLPAALAGHSARTAAVSTAPAGRAIALYRFDVGDWWWQDSQLVVVGADGRSYRQVDLAAGRGARWRGQAAPEPVEALLSPDGTRVAIEDGRGRTTDDDANPAADIAVVDLTTGRSRTYPVPANATLRVLAWSPDGRRLAYAVAPPSTDDTPLRPSANPYLELELLDLDTGAVTRVPGQRGTRAVAFAPDGRRLAVQVGTELRIVTAQGRLERRLRWRLTAMRNYLPWLAGPAAWSPDGARIAAFLAPNGVVTAGAPGEAAGGLAIIELATGEATEILSGTNMSDLRTVLGWRAADVLVDRRDHVAAVPLDGGPPQRLATVPQGDGDQFVDRLQLATALLPNAQIRDAGVDRGPWPWWLRLLIPIPVLVVAVILLTTWVRARASRHRLDRLAGSPSPALPATGVRGPRGSE